MPVTLEFYNLIIPVSVIEEKYPGGWEQCVKDHDNIWSAVWYDEHLFRLGAMNSMDIGDIIAAWEGMGFKASKRKNGQKLWKDFCVLGTLSGHDNWQCEWLETDSERWCAYLKGTDPGGIIYGHLYPPLLRMAGAMVGDIAGSWYEWHNTKRKPGHLIRERDYFTDDTVLTYGVALGILEGMKKADRSVWMSDAAMQDAVEKEIAVSMKQIARKYPHAGYGASFKKWIHLDTLIPNDSWGNGSAMRASFAGWYAESLEEAELLGKISARFTHGHELGIKGAVVVAGCIYLLRTGHGKEEVRQYARGYYDIDFTLDEIRPSYEYDVSCEGSVPQALAAFFENDNFADVVGAAISIGGDSDTIAAIAGSIAEACYEVPTGLLARAWDKLDSRLKFAVRTVSEVLRRSLPLNEESMCEV
jgi:type I restriction enzyme M protein